MLRVIATALGPATLAAFPPGVGHVGLVGLLLAAQANLLGVDNDDKIAGVQVGGVGGFGAPAQEVGDLDSETTQNGAISIDNVPLTLVQIDFRQKCFHCGPI